MMNRTIESEAKEYVYDLKNCANEFGFNNQESWQFSLVTDAEKTKIEKDYYPTVSVHPAQEVLFEFLRLVKGKLMLPVKNEEHGFDVNSFEHKDVRHLIAFNPKMRR
jgi:hypothetical protein